jgi:hypothetical protein
MAQGRGKAPTGGGAQWGAGPATGEAPRIEAVARGAGYEVYRVYGDVVRLVVKYVDRDNSDIYTMRIIELDKNKLRIYTKWNLSPERRGERLDKVVKLSRSAAAELRQRMLSVSAQDFAEFMRELGL